MHPKKDFTITMELIPYNV